MEATNCREAIVLYATRLQLMLRYGIKLPLMDKVSAGALAGLKERGVIYTHNNPSLTPLGERFVRRYLVPEVESKVTYYKLRDRKVSALIALRNELPENADVDFKRLGVVMTDRTITGFVSADEMSVADTGAKQTHVEIVQHQQREHIMLEELEKVREILCKVLK